MSLPPESNASARLWRFGAVLLIAALAVAVAATFRDYGISWDEEVQNNYGQKLLAFYLSGFRDRAALSYMNLYFYGGFFDLVAAPLNTVSPFGVFETRHLWGGVFFLGGLIGAWRLTDLLAGPRAAAVAVALLGVNALLYGHAFINPKDAPLGWLSLWLMYYAGRAIVEETPRTATILGFAVSAGLALGTRILALPLLGYVACALVLGALARRFLAADAPAVGRAAAGLAAGLPLAYAVMALCWPWAIQAPFNPAVALHEFTNFPWQGEILWNGRMVSSAALPRSYLLVLLGYQLSEATLLGLLAAGLGGIALVVRHRFALFRDRRTLPVLIVIAAGVVPFAGFVLLTPTIYNGLRHFLFAVPPLGILAALGWEMVFRALPGGRGVLAGAILAALLGGQALAMVRLHPYQYISYNAFAGGLPGAEGRFELDYWDTSFAELSRLLAARLAAEGGSPTVLVCGNRLSAAAFLPSTVRFTYKVEEADYLMSIAPSPCGYLADVTRDRVLEVRREGVLLSYVVDLRPQRAAAP